MGLFQSILNPGLPVVYVSGQKLKGRNGIGCSKCPLDGGTKLLGLDRIKGRRGMIWGFFPQKADLQKKLELSSGKGAAFFWGALRKHGLSRSDFDVQNVLRCRPVSRDESYERNPTPTELRHCSHHSEHALALNRGNAEVHLILGKDAARALLGPDFKAAHPAYWSEKLAAMVFVLDPPDRVLNSRHEWRKEEFLAFIDAAAWYLKHPGRWSYLEAQDFRMLTKTSTVRQYLNRLRSLNVPVSVDIEEGTVRGKAALLCVGFSEAPGKARCIILDHPQNPQPPQRRAEVWELVKSFLEDAQVKKILQYGCSDLQSLWKNFRIRLRGYWFDTNYAHYLAYTFLHSHGLHAIASLHHPKYASYKELLTPYRKGKKDLNYADIPLDTLSLYNCADASLTNEIYVRLRDRISLPLLKVYIHAGITLYRMQERGPNLDYNYYREVSALIPNRLKKVANELRILADDPNLNLNTPDEIGRVLFDKLKLPDPTEAEGRPGTRSTKEEVLELLCQKTGHPFPRLLLEYRKLAKMESTYLKGYKGSADIHGGELRTKWHLTGAVTGRLRSGGAKDGYRGIINMQNLHGSAFLQNLIVSDVNWGRVLPFLKRLEKNPGLPIPDDILDLEVFMAFDYSQIEIRMLAECSRDEKLISQFRSGLDIHCAVGAALTGLSPEQIKHDKETRTFIKGCHFGIVFGLDAEGLFYYLKARGIKGITQKKVTKFHKAYFRTYDGVAKFIAEKRKFAEENDYVETIFGFRRLIGSDADEGRATNPMNQAVNTPIQGAAHTLLLTAMAALAALPKTYHLLQKPIMEVHDALVFKVQLRDLPLAYAMAKKLLENDVPVLIRKWFNIDLQVPLLSDGSAAFRYGTMVEMQTPSICDFLLAWGRKNQEIESKITAEYRNVV